MKVFGIVVTAASLLVFSGCNPGRYLKKAEVAKVNAYCAEGRSQTHMITGKALLDRVSKIAKKHLERLYKLIGEWEDCKLHKYCSKSECTF